jgi:hypothetical protein
MFAPCDQQYSSHRVYSSNEISSVHFLLDSFLSFDWTPTPELEMAHCGPIDFPLFFNPHDSPSPPHPFPIIPCQTRDQCHPHPLQYTPSRYPLPSSPLPSSTMGHHWCHFADHYHHRWLPRSPFLTPIKSLPPPSPLRPASTTPLEPRLPLAPESPRHHYFSRCCCDIPPLNKDS